MQKPFTYSRGTDGCDNTFDIIDAAGEHVVSVHYWDAKAEAEERARHIVNALNAYKR